MVIIDIECFIGKPCRFVDRPTYVLLYVKKKLKKPVAVHLLLSHLVVHTKTRTFSHTQALSHVVLIAAVSFQEDNNRALQHTLY